jgi:sigma-B regulation protein RsbU (phosphoserine phosphatase)
VRELEAPGIVLGVLDEIELAESEIGVAPGDLLIFYTDAVTEAIDSRQQPFGEERLRELVGKHARAGAKQVLESVIEAVQNHSGDVPVADDMTLLIVKRCPSGLANGTVGQ